jgi:hypothetical protein
VLQLLQSGTLDEFVRSAYLDALMFGDGDGSYRFGRTESHVAADLQRESLGLGFKAATHCLGPPGR